MPWVFYELSRNPSITYQDIEDIEENIEKDWEWEIISMRNLPLDFIAKHLDKVEFYFISLNKNINYNFVKQHIKMPWVWANLSENPQ